jgi:hypothetical protein
VLFAFALVVGMSTQAVARQDSVKKDAEKAVDKTVETTKDVGQKAADKAEDAGDKTAKGAKKSGNWLKRAFRKIF